MNGEKIKTDTKEDVQKTKDDLDKAIAENEKALLLLLTL